MIRGILVPTASKPQFARLGTSQEVYIMRCKKSDAGTLAAGLYKWLQFLDEEETVRIELKASTAQRLYDLSNIMQRVAGEAAIQEVEPIATGDAG